MNSALKQSLKKIVGTDYINKYHRAVYLNNSSNKFQSLMIMKDIKVYNNFNFSNIINNTKEPIIFSKHFVYFIDFKFIMGHEFELNNNMTPDYSVVLDNCLDELKKVFVNNGEEINFILELENYLDIYIEQINTLELKNKKLILKNLKNIKNNKCSNFVEALQRVLFFNQLFWQFGYNLCGLGRLDFILNFYYENDLKNGLITSKKAKEIIHEFYYLLNYHYKNKSNCLIGDTGQIIVLGGLDKDGNNVENELTELFIEVLNDFNKPDPKIYLRVNKNTSEKIIYKAMMCIASGIGSPIISNDEIIIPKLIDFGYDPIDVWNYVPAACWEPSICGNSIDLNNVGILNLLEPLSFLFKEEHNLSLTNIENKYFDNLKKYIQQQIISHQNIHYDKQPYLSLFISDCHKTKNMVLADHIKYKNIGFTTLGLSNVVNCFLNIEMLVNQKKIISLKQLNNFRQNNFQDNNVLLMLKQNNKIGFGSTNIEAVKLTNKIIKVISDEFDKYTTNNGGNFKFGLSGPSYVEIGNKVKATYDGRKNFEPLGVHISSYSNNYLDIMSFADKINYPKNCINGNVVDFIVNSSYININLNKFTKYIRAYLNKNIYQLQINVIDSKTLISAKEHPELYSNLIVRVWGFSAYFNDLPEEYKNLIIERALQAEGI